MRSIAVDTAHSQSEIAIGNNWQPYVGNYLKNRKVIIVTDTTVYSIYGCSFLSYSVITIPAGEEHKTLSTVEFVIREALKHGLDRSGFILGIGGGVVCDIVGFVASVYMRGVDFGFVATTLLAQADASIGGKNGVDFDNIKNIVGVINQPRFVYCDTSMLSTLSNTDFLSGIAEVLKIGFVGDSALIDFAEKHRTAILERSANELEELVYCAAKFKARVVSVDEKERGERRVLNFGHTYGHAIEMIAGCCHGLAVAAGMKIAATMSAERGLLSNNNLARVYSTLENFGLNQTYYEIDNNRLNNLIIYDKKRENNFIYFVLLKAIGCGIVQPINIDELKAE